MTDTPIEQKLPPSLRLLKILVIALMITMIGAVITITGLLVTRMPRVTTPVLPASLELPADTTALAFTTGPGWFAVTTADNRILIFSPDGKLAQEIRITLP
ncbi:MAG: DUF6476 family protein [Cypionkella sp.]|nr:hypothetical protein [Cypionkella sp.]